MSKKDLISLRDSDFYKGLIEEIEAVVTTRMTNSRMEVLAGKWEVGKAIADARGDFERFGYGENAIGLLSKDLGMSASGLYKCLQFYDKYPGKKFDDVVMSLPEGNNISWYKMTQKYLPGSNRNERKDLYHYISVRVNDEEKTIAIKEKYRDYKIEYY